jgi:hypothetical protein
MFAINPLAYWPEDPNGWLRHLVIGLLMGAILVRFRLGAIWFWIAVLIAVGKEFADSFIEYADILWTIGGTAFPKLIAKWQTFNH